MTFGEGHTEAVRALVGALRHVGESEHHVSGVLAVAPGNSHMRPVGGMAG